MPSYTAETLDKLQIIYCTASLGMHRSHDLVRKLKAIASAGFQGLELGFDDLVNFAIDNDLGSASYNSILKHVSSDNVDNHAKTSQEERETWYEAMGVAAGLVKERCSGMELEVYCLQPFSMFEGYEDEEKRKENFEKAERWLKLANQLGARALQVGSNADPNINESQAVKDLCEISDMAAKYSPPILIAFENWCWSSYARTWSAVHSIAQEVDRPNFGLCLDTFQSAGSEIADPSTESGFMESSQTTHEQLHEQWHASLADLSKSVPGDKIFYLQISDAVKPEPRITENHKDYDEINETRGLWSHDYRPLPYGEGYLPWLDFTKAVLETGFQGTVSMEVFESKMKEEDFEMEAYAKRAMEVWRKMKVNLVKE